MTLQNEMNLATNAEKQSSSTVAWLAKSKLEAKKTRNIAQLPCRASNEWQYQVRACKAISIISVTFEHTKQAWLPRRLGFPLRTDLPSSRMLPSLHLNGVLHA